MATESSPKLHQSEHSKSKFDSQTSTTIEQDFLAPLGDSQETGVTSDWHDENGLEPVFPAAPEDPQEVQGVTSKWRNDHGSHEETVINQPPQSPKGPFFSRPVHEDPLNFQDGFQYSKAPAPQILSVRPNAPRKGAGLQSDWNYDGGVKKEHPSHGPGSRTIDDPLNDSRDMRGLRAKASEPSSKTRAKAYDAVFIPSDPSSNNTLATDEQPGRSTPKHLALGSPFQNTSPFIVSAPFQQPKVHAQSPATRLERPRLPKAFADIQRKALIQSNHTNSLNQSAHHSKSQVSKASSRFNTPEVHQDLAQTHQVSYIQTRQHQEHPARDPASNQSPHTPKTQAPARKRRKNRPDAMETTRPFTREAHKDCNIITRPVSQASNISRKRAPREKECTRTRERQANPGTGERNVRGHKLIQAWNDYFIHEDLRNKHWEEKMDDMVEQIAERDGRVAEYLAKIQEQEQIIADLETAKQEHCTIRQEQEVTITKLEERRQRLRERMKEYRERLNDATTEQQNIFKYFQPRYHEMRQQMKQAELKHQDSLQQALSAADQVRDKIRKSVEEVQTLSQQEIQKLCLEIRTLEAKLAEREKDVDREKDHVNDLRRELEKSHKLNELSLKSLNMQNKELMNKSDHRAIQIQNVEQCINRQEQRIQSLQKFLEDDKATTQTPSEMADSLKVLQQEALNSILFEVQQYAESDRERSSKATEGLIKEILGIRESCTSLSEQIQSSQNASEWQEKFGKAQMDYQTLLRETDRLKEKLAKMHDEAKTQREEQESLQRELSSLRASAKATDASNTLIENLEKEKQKIQGCLDEKEICIRGLEDQLREVNEALSAQDCRLKDQDRQLHGEREKLAKAIAKCHEQRDEAVKQAREECTRTQAECHNIENRLHDAEQDCSRLQEEIVRVKQRAKNALQNSKDEAASQAQEILKPMADLMNKVSEGLQTSEQAKGDLHAKLEAWSNDHVEMSVLRQAVQKLAKDQEKNIENGKLLGELLDVQKRLDNTWQWHKSEVDALNRAAELEKSVKADMERASLYWHKGKQIPEILHVTDRHVTIRSPGIDYGHNERMAPLSVEEEQVTRRQVASLKGIMKPPVLQVEGRPEEQYHETFLATTKQAGVSSKQLVASSDAKSALVSHSAYNRPVLGSFARLEGPANGSLPENTETEPTEMVASKKRKRAETEADQRGNAVETIASTKIGTFKKTRAEFDAYERERAVEKMRQSAEKRRLKISDSMSSDIHNPNPKGPATNAVHLQAQLWHSRGGPIEQRPRSFVTYGLKGLGTRGGHVDSTPSTSSGGSRMSSLENPEPHVRSFNLRP
ncbi:hypothetical protein F4824DRAFT_512785 [Ustulina deusta]|nr:hypothetical protein F4824DRAFT_512785 [Ustulina deusta]